MTPRGVPWLLAVLLALATLASTGEPLRDEDVVRMFVSGENREAILERIRSSETEFDLSEEMLEELRIAGIPETLIQAMIVRQAEIDAASAHQEPSGGERSEPAPADPATSASPRIVFTLSVFRDDIAGQRRKPWIHFPATASQRMAEVLELGPSEEDRAVTGAAYFLACRTPEHVPDHWRSETPIGRDFILMPRHRMLSFHPDFERLGPSTLRKMAEKMGSTENGGKKKSGKKRRKDAKEDAAEEAPEVGRIRLVLPESLAVELEPGTRHDLLVGIALEIGDRYYLLASADLEDVELAAGEDLAVNARVRPAKRTGFSLEIDLNRQPAATEP